MDNLELWYRANGKQKFLNSQPPLTFKVNGEPLKNYCIYGNTVNGESVGDRTENLFDEVYPYIDSTIKYKAVYVGDGVFKLSTNIGVYSGTTNLFLLAGNVSAGADSGTSGVHSNQPRTVNAVDGYVTIGYRARGGIDPRNGSTMLNSGSTVKPYEPYGYKVPVTVTNGTDTQTTNIYIPEQIKMVGDEAEYIDYEEQKQHFADGTSADIALPTLPTFSGTNTLSVGTEVQPSSVAVTTPGAIPKGLRKYLRYKYDISR